MIGIIGFGRFGELAARYLARDVRVVVFDRGGKTERIRAVGALPADLETTCRQEMVLLSVPISYMQTQLKTIAPLLKPGTVVIDVCSVKVNPVKWMTALLPSDVEILPTHPMFGPDSAADTLAGAKIVLCRDRISPANYARAEKWLREQELVVIETTPEAHDRQIAVTLALTHFLGRSLSAYGAENLEIDTEGYKRLMHILEVVENDTWQLFQDMHHYNPFADEERTRFMDAMAQINLRLEEKR
ncbi:MAG: prephenate dehydrogenase/arogenate dehydrogenase family protein [Desulfosarcinaceae bacterium]|nr:prephenate dehydrogenase/arogenate dehydrogenase family protein [Desulfosarcinaceae bacterium]